MQTNLTTDQASALETIEKFLTARDEFVFLLCGSAGTGKTTLTRSIIRYLRGTIVVLSPTHKAKRVLQQKLYGMFVPITILTVSAFMGKMRELSYIGAKSFCRGNIEMHADFILLDEVSMIGDKDLDILLEYVSKRHIKMIAIGDQCQIPPISQSFIRKNGLLVKKDCKIFSVEIPRYELREIVRQKNDSIILIATFIRNNLQAEWKLVSKFPTNCIARAKLYAQFVADWKEEPLGTKIIAYTNQAVHHHNSQVRKELGFSEQFCAGEILTSYQTIGKPPIIENSFDYEIEHVELLTKPLKGWKLLIREDAQSESLSVFFPDIISEVNEETLQRLVKLAHKVNAVRSTTADYARYKSLKDSLLFMENIYSYCGKIYTEQMFKESHPFLFLPVSELIKHTDDGYVLLENDTVNIIQQKYPNILQRRLSDNKPLSDQETLSACHCVIEKDFDYGYTITAHKSQGSTFKTVYVDEPNLDKIKNFKRPSGATENRVTERNKLKYVAITRASDALWLVDCAGATDVN